jgi:3-phenylpropionate/trans-cinnamate dioxygenase ferredoxin reductase subunit
MKHGIVIVGGGLAGQRCAETLRRAGYDGRVRIVCAEPHRPYDRPPLSKEALATEVSVAFRPAGWYDDNDVELRLGVRATRLYPRRHEVRLSDDSTLPYDKLLVATGSRPRRLPLLERFANVSALRTLDDARDLRATLAGGARLAIVGAGFIGQEVAAAARHGGVETTMVEAAPVPLDAVLGRDQGEWFAALHRAHGVDLRLGRQVAEAHGNGRVESLRLDDGTAIDCDQVLVGIGVQPDLDWVIGSGLDPTGIRTDAVGRTPVPDVWAAGDAAAVFDPILGRHVPGGHWESAARQGARVARAMLGLEPGALPPASFWSDLYGTRVHYLGHARGADEVSVDGDPDARDFTATFTRSGRPVAVLLVGRAQGLPAARDLLAA